MKPNLLKILTFFFVLFESSSFAQEIWKESFLVPEKGVWGDESTTSVHQNFDGITSWTLDYSKVSLSNADDYAKTVSTSGGRFECRDINGEVIWYSEQINISDFKNVSVKLQASETGGGANENNKYLKAYFLLDKSEQLPFQTNGENLGNWGSNTAEQTGLEGDSLQIVVYINNHYASDKVILDELVVSGEEKNPVVIHPGDILINEVLFNPFPEGEDFVEIYNYSGKEISVNYLYLASRDKEGELIQIYQLSTDRILFPAKTYLALTKDTNAIFPFFNIKCAECFLQMEKFPSFNNDKDVVVLLDHEMEIIDEFHYTDKMHAPLLADEEGISLERVSFEEETNKFTNWHSASTESGYGTPGYENSQIINTINSGVKVAFHPESFSPNSDGYNDEFKISYQTQKPGSYINISIFDAAGRYVMHLAKNEILGTSGEYTWSGKDKTGQRQNLGVYIVVVEIFDLNGNIHRFKDGVILTEILE